MPALRFPVTADLSQFDKAMTDAGQRVHEESEHIEGHFNDINKAAGTLALAFTVAGGAITAALLSAVTSLAKIGDLSDDLRLPVSLIQSLTVAADEARVPASLLTSAMEKFAQTSKDVPHDFEKSLRNIGPAFLEAFKSADTQEERLKIISNALKSTSDEVKRAQLSLQAFGTDNERLIGILGAGASSFETYRQNAARLGLEINESMVKAAQEAKSQLLLLSRVLSDQFTGAVTNLIPALLKILPALQAIALAAQAVGVIFASDDTASVSQLNGELSNLVDQWTRLKTALNDLQSGGRSKADDVRDKLREWFGLSVSVGEETKSLEEQLAKVQTRIETVKKLIASKEAAPAKDKPAFEERPPLSPPRDRFEAAADSIQKRTEALTAETGAIDLGTAARERAKIAAQLLTVAHQVNKEAGLGDKVVTEEQTKVIDEFSAAFGRASAAMEQARSPLATFGRDSANLGKQLNQFAATSLDSMTNALADVVTHTKTASEAFSAMAKSIINDLARIAIRQSITGPIASGLSGLFGGSVLNVSGGVGKNASGTDNWSGGPTWVGENGPEIINAPRGSQIIPNNIASRGGSSSGPPIIYAPTIDARGADAAAVARLASAMADDRRNFERNVMATVRGNLRLDAGALNRN